MRLSLEPAQAFEEPWHAELFATTHALSATGIFSWTDWAAYFGTTLAAADAAGSPKDGSTYYDIWLTAFEEFIISRELCDREALTSLRDAWTDAYLTTPHGAPVQLRDANSIDAAPPVV